MSSKKEKARRAVRGIARVRGVHVGIAKAIYLAMSRSQQQRWRARYA